MNYSTPIVVPDLACYIQRNFGTKTLRFLGKLSKLNTALAVWLIQTLTCSDESAVIARTWQNKWSGEFDPRDFNFWNQSAHNYQRKVQETLDFFKAWYGS